MSTAAKVGAFFLVVLALAGLLIWKIEDLRIGRKAGKTISIQFADVAGLKEKADVRIAGVLVGKVAKIRLVGGKAIVDVELNKDISLRDGATGTIQSLGMLGDKYVELVPGPVGAPPLAEGTTLRGDAPVSFDQITKLARDIEVDVREITSNLKSSLGGALGEERLTGIVENVLILSQELRKLLESNRANIDSTTANFRDFSTQMTQLVNRIDKLVASNSGNVTDSVSNAKELTAKLQTTVDNMNAITGKINEGHGHRRRPRQQRRDEQEPERDARRRQGGRQQPLRLAEDREEDQLRPGAARGVPDRPEQGEGVLHGGSGARGKPALLPRRARRPSRSASAGTRRRSSRRPIRTATPRPSASTRPSSRTPSPSPRRSGTGSGTGSPAPGSRRTRAAPESTTSPSRTDSGFPRTSGTSAGRTT